MSSGPRDELSQGLERLRCYTTSGVQPSLTSWPRWKSTSVSRSLVRAMPSTSTRELLLLLLLLPLLLLPLLLLLLHCQFE